VSSLCLPPTLKTVSLSAPVSAVDMLTKICSTRSASYSVGPQAKEPATRTRDAVSACSREVDQRFRDDGTTRSDGLSSFPGLIAVPSFAGFSGLQRRFFRRVKFAVPRSEASSSCLSRGRYDFTTQEARREKSEKDIAENFRNALKDKG